MQPGFEKPLTKPKSLPDDGNRYIFPVGVPAPGSNIAPASPEAVSVPSIETSQVEQPTTSGEPISRTPAVSNVPAVQVPETKSPDISGVTGEVDAATKAMLAQEPFLKDIESKSAQTEKTRAELLAKQEEIKKINDEVANFKWDNRSLWDKSSTGQKVALLIGGFLSSMSPQGADSFRKSIESSLDRDMFQQKSKYDALKDKGRSAESHLGLLTQRLGSEEAGVIALRSQQLQLIQNKLKAVQDNAQSKIMAMNAAKGWEMLEVEKGKLGIELQKLIQQKAGDIKNISLGPYKGMIGDEVAARDFRKKYNAVESANSTINELKALTKKGAYVSPEARAAVQSRLAVLVQQSKDILGTGVLSDAEREALMSAIGDPTSTFSLKSSTLAKLESFQKQLNQMVQQEAKSYGLYKEIGANK